MTNVSHLSERIPAVAHGRTAWTEAERRHLAECAECAAEWELVRTAAGLGLEVEHTLASEPLAERVLEGLRRPQVSRRPRVRRLVWAAPAVAAAVLMLVFRSGPTPETDPAALSLLPEIAWLETDDLQALLDILPAGNGWSYDMQSLEDLTEEELEGILRSMEG